MPYTIYMFPGLGADEAIFRHLSLPDYEIVHIRWIKPLNDETVAEYAARLRYQIKEDSIPILLGLSFGGMVAQEMAKLVDPAKVILISSIKHERERPLQVMLAEKFRPHKYIPSLLAIEFDFWYPFAFGKTNKMEKAFIKSMARGIHPDFTDWATDACMKWKNTERIPNLVHIHGTKDNLFPACWIQNAIFVKGGTHFMVYQQAGLVSEIILQHLATIPNAHLKAS